MRSLKERAGDGDSGGVGVEMACCAGVAGAATVPLAAEEAAPFPGGSASPASVSGGAEASGIETPSCIRLTLDIEGLSCMSRCKAKRYSCELMSLAKPSMMSLNDETSPSAQRTMMNQSALDFRRKANTKSPGELKSLSHQGTSRISSQFTNTRITKMPSAASRIKPNDVCWGGVVKVGKPPETRPEALRNPSS